MKTVEVKITTLDLRAMTGKPTDVDKFADTCDILEVCLDNIPQGGYTPKDIRERNRLQVVIDEFRTKRKEDTSDKKVKPLLKFEDADYDALKIIVNNSRWGIRSKDLQGFLDTFKE
jgi:hypothetical protein